MNDPKKPDTTEKPELNDGSKDAHAAQVYFYLKRQKARRT